jgi:arylsulfatase A-like enzyme
MAAIEGEQLGKRNVTDFLALSFSSPDYIGHTFGPNSIEVEDNYLRLDKELGEFLKYLDAKIGKGEYLIFLTADHGVAHNPLFMKEHNLASGTFDETTSRRQLNEELSARFNTKGIIEYVTNYQYFLNDSIIKQNNLDKKQIKDFIIAYLLKQEGVARVADLSEEGLNLFPEKIRTMLINGYNQKLSGDLQILFKPQWYENWRTGASHGLWNPYDAHIPLLWYGWNIKPGRLVRETYMTDIAPTLAALLHIQMPNACIGHAIQEVVRN